jgi:hypothetical protein
LRKRKKEFLSLKGKLSATRHEEVDSSVMRGAAVFKDEDPLPGPQGHLAIDNGNNFTCAGEGHAQVTGGIIGTFESVNVVAGLRRDSFEIAVEISPRARVGIFVTVPIWTPVSRTARATSSVIS